MSTIAGSKSAKEYGEERLIVAREAKSREDWDRLWKESAHPFAFTWGECWNQTAEYVVDDFAAEIGFYIDILGLECNALSEEYAMVNGPKKEFFLSVVPSSPDRPATPKDSIKVEFMIDNIVETSQELERRGIRFEARPAPDGEGSTLYTGLFRSPNGTRIGLWGIVKKKD
jgi:hypothetical protein